MLRGGDTGPAVVPGKSSESLLVQALRHEDGLEMPPKAPRLADEVVARFVKWIDAGAPTPRASSATAMVAPGLDDARGHWAFQPIARPEPPAVNDPAWVETPVDAFVLAKLEERGWRPAPDASRSDWLRRVTFDLTGLPPTPEEVEAFERDASPNAFDSVADRLLASPRYGERWAQHWLDVVRFAETEGFEYDRHIPDAWRFRDYVIGSLNRDKPYNRFVAEQIAGDEIAPADREGLTASAFHRLGPVRRNAGNPDIALSRNEVLTERTDIIGTAFLGLTVGCARCHNHKLEPISQKDYYRLQAYLAATEESNISLAPEKERTAWEAETKSIKDRMEQVRARMKRVRGPDRERLAKELEALEDQLPAPLATIPATRNDFEHRTAVHVLKRGEWEDKGEPVGPRPPSVLVPDDQPELPADVADPRTRLAAWLTDPSHPLTARVFVNRVWQYHFGTGLVKTVNDFGTKGDRPSHPELLDWLASSFTSGGWRLKPMHRLIVLSHAYRQSDRSSPIHRGRNGRPGEPPALAFRSPPAHRRGDPRRHARRLRPVEPQGRRPERHAAGRPRHGPAPLQALAVEGRQRRGRARSALDLPDRQAQPSPSVPGCVRLAGPHDQLRPPRVEHPRASGARAPERPARRTTSPRRSPCVSRPSRAVIRQRSSAGRLPSPSAASRRTASGRSRSNSCASSRSRSSRWPSSI